jgi:isopropylmalate/homocitrate/citramalate synthase
MATLSRVTSGRETWMRHPDAALNLHFHNTRGTGLANVLAALQLGVMTDASSAASAAALMRRARPATS